jgi:hypothetical protein
MSAIEWTPRPGNGEEAWLGPLRLSVTSYSAHGLVAARVTGRVAAPATAYLPSAGSTRALAFSTWEVFDLVTARAVAEAVGQALLSAVGGVIEPEIGPPRPREWGPVSPLAHGWRHREHEPGIDRWVRERGPLYQVVGDQDASDLCSFWTRFVIDADHECDRVQGSMGTWDCFRRDHAIAAADAVGTALLDTIGPRLSPRPY